MKRTQGKSVIGYVSVYVSGENSEFFFQACANVNIPIWDIKKIKSNKYVGKIYMHHMKKVTAIAEQLQYDILLQDSKGYFSYLLRLWTKKEIILSILLCSIIIFVISNIVWKVDVTGVSTDTERKINEQLIHYGLSEGSWAYSLEPLDIIQQDVLNQVPELLYIGIQKKGTTYHVDAVEKLIVNETEQLSTQHLVATKNGIIQKMFVKKGIPVVEVNDFVKKGDLLVSGIIEQQPNDEEKEKEEIAKEIVAADGEVYANTWYEVTVNSSLYRYHEKLSGKKEMKYYLQIGTIQVPIWGFNRVPFEETFIEKDKKQVYFLKWKTPAQIIQKNIYDKESFAEKRSVDDAKTNAIKHVKNDLQLKLGKDVKILKYYVLHESVDNGKVKLNLYISVLENIANGKPIH